MADRETRALERTWRQTGTVAAAQEYLRALERDGADEASRAEVRLELVRAQLTELGVEPDKLRPFREAPCDGYVLSVPGVEAARTWEVVRGAVDELGMWPLLVGQDTDWEEDLEREAWYEPEQTPQAILAAADGLGPDLFTLSRARGLAAAALMREHGQEEVAAGIEAELEAEAHFDEAAALAEEWGPAIVASEFHDPDALTITGESMGPACKRMWLALLPSPRGWEAPAWLLFGGFNRCPGPAEQVATLRDWWKRFGAGPIAMTGDTLELNVARRPTTRPEALRLARELNAYCPDAETPITSQAADLLERRRWLFWWG